MITIEEIDNSEAQAYTSNKGEEYSNLSYQINGYVRTTSNFQASELAEILLFEINKVLGEEYRMNRLGSPILTTLPADANIKVISVRYNCVFSLEENRIYKG